MANLENVEGIGKAYAEKLKKAGVRNTVKFLEEGKTPQGRKKIAKESGVSAKLILEWLNHIDLCRVKGIGPEYSDLLEEAGVDTVPELATRKAKNLLEAIEAANTKNKKKLVRQTPNLSKIENWIAQAKKLPRVIEY